MMNTRAKDNFNPVEESFFDPDLLKTNYMQRHREGYYDCVNKGRLLNINRNYFAFIRYMEEIY